MPELSLDDIFEQRQFSVKKHAGSDRDMLTKIVKAPASWDDDKRTARFIMTSERRDRYGDVVRSKGAVLDDFMGNPVALWAHMSREFPIGMWSDLTTIGGKKARIEGTLNLNEDGTHEDSDTIAKLLKQGHVRACSIGFIPLEWEALDKENPWDGYDFKSWEMLECSVCSIPAQPDALVKAAGGNDRLLLQAIELVLDEWTRTPAGTIVPRREFERAYTVAKKEGAKTIVEVRAVDETVADPSDDETWDFTKSDPIVVNVNTAPTGDDEIEALVAQGIKDWFAAVEKKEREAAEAQLAADEVETLALRAQAMEIVNSAEAG